MDSNQIIQIVYVICMLIAVIIMGMSLFYLVENVIKQFQPKQNKPEIREERRVWRSKRK